MYRRTFVLTWLIYCAYYLCRKNFSVLMPFLKAEQGYSAEALAHVLFLYSLAYAGGQLLMGSLSDRWGARVVVTAGACISAGCSALTGTLFPLTLAQGVNGLAQAGGWPGVLKLTREWFPSGNRAVVMAWWGTHLVVGGFIATNLAAWLTQEDWRRAAWVPSILLLIVATAFALGARDQTVNHQDATAATPRGPLVLNPALIAIAAMYFCVKMARYSFLFWLPLYMTERLRYSPQQAGYSSSIFEAAGFGGALAAGYLSERAVRGSRFAVGTVMMLLLGLLCVIYPIMSTWSAGANLVGIALIGACTFGPDTLMAGPATQESAPRGATARAAGFVNGVGSVGQVVSPYLVAFVSSKLGWDALFWMLGAVALAGSAALSTQWAARGRRP